MRFMLFCSFNAVGSTPIFQHLHGGKTCVLQRLHLMLHRKGCVEMVTYFPE